MPRLPVTHPRVQRAIQYRQARRTAQRCQKAILAELSERDLRWPELVELTEFSREEVAAALDALRIAGRIESLDGWKYRLVESGELLR